MKNIDGLCISCFENVGQDTICPHCGFNKDTYEPPAHHLPPGTILAGKYLLGKKIGEGGFGITYIGYDLNLEIKVAIKEYFPSGSVTRIASSSNTVTVYDGEYFQMFMHGRDKFIEEARTLAKFDNFDGIVSVKDFFTENGTAYIVMEYLQGQSLGDFLKSNGVINYKVALDMIKPILTALKSLHACGLIHRDISPDNIMITQSGSIKLIDFGAAREISLDAQKSLSVQLRPGYAPE